MKVDDSQSAKEKETGYKKLSRIWLSKCQRRVETSSNNISRDVFGFFVQAVPWAVPKVNCATNKADFNVPELQ